jgi:uncharacterized membrane protein
MENIVISTFGNAQQATEGLTRLKELDQLGDISIYNMVMIRKTNEGHFELLHHSGPDTSNLPTEGGVAGTLIGAIGGPIGMAIGLVTGIMAGSVDEADREGMSKDFLEKVNKQLTVGVFAIVLDVEEDSEFMINTYMKPYNGTTTHTDIVDQYDKYNQEQWDELNKEIADTEKEWQLAREEDKAAIKAKIEKLKSEKAKKVAKIKERALITKEHLQDKIKSMDQKLKTSDERLKVKLAAHQEKLRDRLNEFDANVAWAFA